MLVESPDYNFMVDGRPERIAANRVVLCVLTEFGLMNNRRMKKNEFSYFIGLTQITTGRDEESERIDRCITIFPQEVEAVA